MGELEAGTGRALRAGKRAESPDPTLADQPDRR